MHLFKLFCLFVFVSFLAASVIFGFRTLWRKESKYRDLAMNVALMVFVSAYLVMAFEAYFSCFGAQSDGYNFTRASKQWMERYRGPLNSWGYRDAEHKPESLMGKKVLFVVGDSFTWGYGIRNREDRFSDQLARKLGDPWAVANIAMGGWDTMNELNALQRVPYKPEVVILQYYLNDTKHAAKENGLSILPEDPKVFPLIAPLVESSDLVNRVYWNIYRMRMKDRFREHWENMKRCYRDPAVWRAHEEEIRAFVNYTRTQDIKLLVVIFPNLTAMEESRPLCAQVAGVFQKMGEAVLDLTPVLAGRSPSELVCNPFDAHPNEAVHHEVAGILYTRLKEMGLVTTPAVGL